MCGFAEKILVSQHLLLSTVLFSLHLKFLWKMQLAQSKHDLNMPEVSPKIIFNANSLRFAVNDF